jgi:hypothetical protein|tara:strand:- start:478 stop:1299 length:822 start_codon:yes stop_codon:yes gene_type:complete
MKLKSLGKVFELNPEHNFVYKKNKKLSRVLIDFINITLDCFAVNYNIDAHSIYLRGSCLDRDIVDKDTFDIDLNIVHEDESVESSMWLHSDYHPQIMQKMEELHGFSVFPDVDIRHKNFFLHKTDTRFYSMKIWGEEDLSISIISHNKIVKYFADLYDDETNRSISQVRIAKEKSNPILVRSAAKVFYRNFGLKALLERGKLSRSVYQCHNALMEKYPKYSKELTNILDLFLNVESYSRQQIIDVLDEMQAVIKCLYHEKSSPHIVKVCYVDK